MAPRTDVNYLLQPSRHRISQVPVDTLLGQVDSLILESLQHSDRLGELRRQKAHLERHHVQVRVIPGKVDRVGHLASCQLRILGMTVEVMKHHTLIEGEVVNFQRPTAIAHIAEKGGDQLAVVDKTVCPLSLSFSLASTWGETPVAET